jgi:hypothetical protein
MYQLTQLVGDRHRQRLAAAEAQRPAGPRSRWPGPPAARASDGQPHVLVGWPVP